MNAPLLSSSPDRDASPGRDGPWFEIANIVLAVGLFVGLLIGVARSRTILYPSLWRPVLRTLTETVVTSVALTAVVVAISLGLVYVLHRLFARQDRWSPPIAGGAFLFVALAYLGYRINHDYLPNILSSTSIAWNLVLGALFAMLAVGFVVWARIRIVNRDATTLRFLRSPSISAVLIVVTIITGLQPSRWFRDSDAPVSIILLVVDGLRPDHLGLYGYGRETSPNIDRLGHDAVTFTQAISQSTFTKTSIASLLTGQFPYRHGVYDGNVESAPTRFTSDVLAPETVTLAEMLRDAGFVTAAWVNNAHLRPEFGFGQGFTEYSAGQMTIETINERMLTWLESKALKDDLFTYAHYLDLHVPYTPEPPYDTMFGVYDTDVYEDIDLTEFGAYLARVRLGEVVVTENDVDQLAAYYDGLIRFIDDEIGKLLERLEALGLYDRSLIVFTADHGDAFMEHGVLAHGTTPYEELARVPLLIKFPGAAHAGAVVEDQVRLVDVMATIAEMRDTPAPDSIDGRSLLPFVEGDGADRERQRFPEYAITEIHAGDAYPSIAIRTSEWKYIHHESRPDELYALKTDPGELHNVAALETRRAAEALQRALDLVKLRAAHDSGNDRVVLDEETVKRLKSLGYIR